MKCISACTDRYIVVCQPWSKINQALTAIFIQHQEQFVLCISLCVSTVQLPNDIRSTTMRFDTIGHNEIVELLRRIGGQSLQLLFHISNISNEYQWWRWSLLKLCPRVYHIIKPVFDSLSDWISHSRKYHCSQYPEQSTPWRWYGLSVVTLMPKLEGDSYALLK